jgi:hypothetical protein
MIEAGHFETTQGGSNLAIRFDYEFPAETAVGRKVPASSHFDWGSRRCRLTAVSTGISCSEGGNYGPSFKVSSFDHSPARPSATRLLWPVSVRLPHPRARARHRASVDAPDGDPGRVRTTPRSPTDHFAPPTVSPTHPVGSSIISTTTSGPVQLRTRPTQCEAGVSPERPSCRPRRGSDRRAGTRAQVTRGGRDVPAQSHDHSVSGW